MGARNKLNGLYFKIAAVVAGIVGLSSGSCSVFVIVLAIIVIVLLAGGDIRLDPKGHCRRR